MTADIGTEALGPSRFEDQLQALELCAPQLESRASCWLLPFCVRFRQPRSLAETCSACACGPV